MKNNLIRHSNFQDASKELRARLNMSSEKDVTIKFEKDTYHFIDEKAENDFNELMAGNLDYDTHWGKSEIPYNKGITIENCNNIILDFNGSTLMMYGLIQTMLLKGSKNITIKNLTVDWWRSPFSIGEVIGSEGSKVIVKIFDDFPIKGGEPVWAIMDYDPIEKHLGEVYKFRNMTPLKLIEKQKVEFSGNFTLKPIIGSYLVIRHVGNYRPCFQLLECENIFFQNVTIHNNPGMGIVGHYTKNIQFRNLQVKPKESHIMSTSTDATHFISCSGLIDFEDCYFEGMGDDAINVHGFYQSIINISEDRKIVTSTILNPNGTQDMVFDAPTNGDRVEFCKSNNLLCFSENIIKRSEIDSEAWQVKITFEKPLSTSIHCGDVFTKVNDCAKLRFVNCIARDIRARAALIQTRGCIIENCKFSYCTGTGIHIDTATGWWESTSTRDIIIRNNIIQACGYGDGTYNNTCGIAVLTECDESAVGVHKNLVIENNQINGNGESTGIYISSAEEVEIYGNCINNCATAIEVDDSTAIHIYGNDIETQAKIVFNNKRKSFNWD
ncbi:right-handed parallel beta-helix repeat-containing protein [Vallitalea okinawensis]|uniref:right-handed parallel beta-helix repeat-containing protein n=1 Tax=Vallitalea okinawensis TaxID=2078660 RepID=UPI000CFCBB38|nr:right-handed parallel beta-helix repeat-containing protein [Vallitalea okinawensis]